MSDITATELKFDLLPPEVDGDAAELLLRALPGVSEAGATSFLATLRGNRDMTLVAALEDGKPIVISVLRKVGVTTELLLIATDPEADPARHLDLAAVQDAGNRVGRRPLTVETNEQSLDWYKRLGFKLVGKKKRPDGTWTYRLGWHGARSAGEPSSTSGATEDCPDPADLLGTPETQRL